MHLWLQLLPGNVELMQIQSSFCKTEESKGNKWWQELKDIVLVCSWFSNYRCTSSVDRFFCSALMAKKFMFRLQLQSQVYIQSSWTRMPLQYEAFTDFSELFFFGTMLVKHKSLIEKNPWEYDAQVSTFFFCVLWNEHRIKNIHKAHLTFT